MKLNVGGYERSFIWLPDTTTGAALGQQGSALPNGSGSPAYLLDDVINAEQAFAQFTELVFKAGDIEGNVMSFGNTKIQPFDILLDTYDSSLNDLIQGVTSITSNPYRTRTAQNPARAQPKPAGLAIQQRAMDADTGNQKYITHFLSKGTATYRRGGAQYQEASNSTLHFAPLLTKYAFTGQQFGSGTNQINLGLALNKTDCMSIISDNPLFLYSFKADGTAVNFTLPYLPVSSVVTLGATPNEYWKAGVEAALTSASISTGAIVIPAAGTAAQIGVVLWDTAFTPS